MLPQVRNPLRFTCAPNHCTPDYATCHNFHDFVAYGLLVCWLSPDADDPNAECNFDRPVTREDVGELRHYFLDLLETVVVALWKGDYQPGDGDIEGDYRHVYIDDGGGNATTFLTWYPRLDADCMMFSLDCTGADETNIWLSYDAIADRPKVAQILADARRTLAEKGDWAEVYAELTDLAKGAKQDA